MKDQHKKPIKTFIVRVLWLFTGVGFLFLFIAAMEGKNKQICKNIVINIDGANDNFYVERADISQLILQDKKMNPTGKQLNDINLPLLEKTIEKNPWVARAQLYIDAKDNLHINVQQKQPLARIFTISGNSFYVDKHGGRVPLSTQFSARVPVFTNFPTNNQKLTGKDSLLYTQIVDMSNFLADHPFWNAQIEQINITPQNGFELIPEVGNQVIELGDGNDIAQKFRKLNAFYKQVLNVKGWDIYDTINLAYTDEIYATKRNADTPQPVMHNINLTKTTRTEKNVQTMAANNIKTNNKK